MLTTLYKKLGEPEKAMDNTEQEFDLLAGTGMTEEEAAADAAATAREAQAAEDKRKEEAEMQASRRRAAAGAGGAGAGTSDGEEEGSDGAREDGSDEEDAKSIEQEVVYVTLCWWCGIACASLLDAHTHAVTHWMRMVNACPKPTSFRNSMAWCHHRLIRQ